MSEDVFLPVEIKRLMVVSSGKLNVINEVSMRQGVEAACDSFPGEGRSLGVPAGLPIARSDLDNKPWAVMVHGTVISAHAVEEEALDAALGYIDEISRIEGHNQNAHFAPLVELAEKYFDRQEALQASKRESGNHPKDGTIRVSSLEKRVRYLEENFAKLANR